MKQVIQSLTSGATEIWDVPSPSIKKGCLLIANRASIISIGTERQLIQFGKANLLKKAQSQPEKVKQVFEKAKVDGWATTWKAVQSKLNQPIPLGYASAGVVVGVGAGVKDFELGDSVASNGPHAEVVCVPENLCAKIPPSVSFEESAFATIGAIGLESLRLLEPTLGENFAVFGLGLVGLVTVQLLRANGCRVFALDFDEKKLELAQTFGAEVFNLHQEEDLLRRGLAFSNGNGVDGAILCAATQSSAPVHQAATLCRKRGRIILSGVTGLELARSDFYEKELKFQVSCSYGPGRYDTQYEELGIDYPFAYVRWTEKRNLEAVLSLLSQKKIDFAPLITHRFDIEKAPSAYDILEKENFALGIVLTTPQKPVSNDSQLILKKPRSSVSPPKNTLGVIGAGNFSSATLLPILKNSGAHLKSIAAPSGMKATILGKRFGFSEVTSDAERLIQDPAIQTIFIASQHDSHAHWVLQCLEHRKNIYVEKPLALTFIELEQIEKVYEKLKSAGEVPVLSIGFNRRFSPLTLSLKEQLKSVNEVKNVVITVNAGPLPKDHWLEDLLKGGGRLVGEGCHFVDLARFIVNDSIQSFQVLSTNSNKVDSSFTLTLKFVNGSTASIHYFDNGHPAFPKENIQVFAGNRVITIDNFRKIQSVGIKSSRKTLLQQDKGQKASVTAFLKAIAEGKESPIPFSEIVEVSKVTLEARDYLYKTINGK